MAEASIRSALGVHSGVSTQELCPALSRSHAYLAAVDRAATLLAEADARDMSGWDFGWLDGRMTSSGLPWDYPAIVDEWVSTSSSVLDMGTGGGEFLSVVRGPARAHRRDRGMASERAGGRAAPRADGHPGRARRGSDRQPRSATARALEDGCAFRDESFDLVHSRHEAYNPTEVRRVLPPRRLVPDATSRLRRRGRWRLAGLAGPARVVRPRVRRRAAA